MAAGLQRGVERVQKFHAITRQVIQRRDFAFLQSFVRKQRIAELLGMARDNFTLAQLGSGGAGAEALDLMLNFGACVVGGIDQGLVEFG